MKKNLIFFFFTLVGLSACAFGFDPYSKSVPVSDQIAVRTADTSQQQIELYFGDQTKPDQPYQQLAYVEAVGNQQSRPGDLIRLLKWEASKYEADAIIEIKRLNTGREQGYAFDDEPNQQYQAPTFNGIAVKYLN